MRFPIRWEELVRLGRFILVVEVLLLATAAILGGFHALLTHNPFLDSFLRMIFVLFVLLLFFALLSGPGAFLSRPKFAPLGGEGRERWRRWLAAPEVGGDREFFDLVLYTVIAFLLLVIATGLASILEAFGGG
ncbi:MAG TPA: hypothetical protein VGR51_00985 [Thermoplasmata archaeon]|jgi:hypothetical protein|nr:hypothetical protein [Thermoplasmata archaeon]